MLLEIGHIGRPHGLNGDVVVQLVSNVTGRLAPGSRLQCRGAELTVECSRPLAGRSPVATHWVVRFSGTTTREAAEQLRGAALLAPAGDEGPAGEAEGALWVHRLIGCRVVGTSGEQRGTVTAVEANPASDLLVLDTGALVPLRFVVELRPGELVADTPAGLFEL